MTWVMVTGLDVAVDEEPLKRPAATPIKCYMHANMHGGDVWHHMCSMAQQHNMMQ